MRRGFRVAEVGEWAELGGEERIGTTRGVGGGNRKRRGTRWVFLFIHQAPGTLHRHARRSNWKRSWFEVLPKHLCFLLPAPP